MWTKEVIFLIAVSLLWFSSSGKAVTEINRILKKEIRVFPAKNVAISVRKIKTGRLKFQHHGDLFLNTASNVKLITGLVSLGILGPEYRFITELYSDNRPRQGFVEGPLYIKGYGDPVLTEERIWLIAKQLKLKGVWGIKGPVIIDNLFFDRHKRNPFNQIIFTSDPYNAETNALSLNFNSLSFTILPGKKILDKAVIKPNWQVKGLRVVNKIKTTHPFRGEVPDLRFNIVRLNEKENVIVFKGRIPINYPKPHQEYVNITHVSDYFGKALVSLLLKEGITLQNKHIIQGEVDVSQSFLLHTHHSEALDRIVRKMNKYSNNFIADQLTKSLDALTNAPPGTFRGGTSLLTEYLKKTVGLPKEVIINSGSGLSYKNRLSANYLTNILVYTWNHFPVASEAISSLSISKVDGTVKSRFKGTKTERLFRVKTGMLSRTQALSGFVYTKGGEVLAFSIIADQIKSPAWKARDFIDKLATLLTNL